MRGRPSAGPGTVTRLADQIRDFVHRRFLEPARRAARNEVRIRAGDVHSDMGLVSRMPAVCGALDSMVLAQRAGIRLLGCTGPRQVADVVFRFAVEPLGHPGVPRVTREPVAPDPGDVGVAS